MCYTVYLFLTLHPSITSTLWLSFFFLIGTVDTRRTLEYNSGFKQCCFNFHCLVHDSANNNSMLYLLSNCCLICCWVVTLYQGYTIRSLLLFIDTFTVFFLCFPPCCICIGQYTVYWHHRALSCPVSKCCLSLSWGKCHRQIATCLVFSFHASLADKHFPIETIKSSNQSNLSCTLFLKTTIHWHSRMKD